MIDVSGIEELRAKMHMLEIFVWNLRKNPANRTNMLLAEAVERLLRVGSSEDIAKGYVMCEKKFSEVS